MDLLFHSKSSPTPTASECYVLIRFHIRLRMLQKHAQSPERVQLTMDRPPRKQYRIQFGLLLLFQATLAAPGRAAEARLGALGSEGDCIRHQLTLSLVLPVAIPCACRCGRQYRLLWITCRHIICMPHSCCHHGVVSAATGRLCVVNVLCVSCKWAARCVGGHLCATCNLASSASTYKMSEV